MRNLILAVGRTFVIVLSMAMFLSMFPLGVALGRLILGDPLGYVIPTVLLFLALLWVVRWAEKVELSSRKEKGRRKYGRNSN